MECINRLNNNKFQVENILRNNKGNFITTYKEKSLRLFEYINGRSFNNSESDIFIAANSMYKIHKNSSKFIEPKLLKKISNFKTPYSLHETSKNIKNIVEYTKQCIKKKYFINSLEYFLENISYIERGINISKDCLINQDCSLTHLDFHQENIIYTNDNQGVIIDFDNAQIGPIEKCSAFSIMRFANYKDSKKLDINSIYRVANIWVESYGFANKNLQIKSYLKWMIFIETEKVLRIIQRYKATKKFSNFITNLEKLHIPNLKFLIDYYKEC